MAQRITYLSMMPPQFNGKPRHLATSCTTANGEDLFIQPHGADGEAETNGEKKADTRPRRSDCGLNRRPVGGWYRWIVTPFDPALPAGLRHLPAHHIRSIDHS
jgi:hypothetical protein